MADTKVSQDLDLSIGLTDFSDFTLLIAKRDPGQGLVWVAFACLIAGITITSTGRAAASGRGSRPTAGSGSSGDPTAMSMSNASSDASSTSSWRSAAG